MYLRLLSAAALVGILIAGISLSARLPNTRAALLSQSGNRGISQNERKLVKSNWRGEPVKVNSLKLRGKPAEFDKAFTDADDDWLRGFSVNLTNTSNKDIVFMSCPLGFLIRRKNLVMFQ
jgi:hypothetical protein